MKLPDGVLAYRFLQSANLKEEHMNLCRATIKEFKYEEMKRKVMSLYGDRVQMGAAVKEEPVFYAGYQSSGPRGRGGRARAGQYHRGRGQTSDSQSQKMNPPGKYGTPSTCAYCGSRFHWIKDCPDKQNNWRSDKEKKVLYNEADEYPPDLSEININLLAKANDQMKLFVGETMGCAVVDSGCAKTVVGKQWLDCYKELPNIPGNLDVKRSNNIFRFGKGSPSVSEGKVQLPATIGSKQVLIETDIVADDVPLLLSKEALKKARTVLDFDNDTAVMFNEKQTLIATNSGHYAIPLTPFVDNVKLESQITLISGVKTDSFDASKIAEKLHRQFCHCSAERLSRLIQSSNIWDAERVKYLITAVNQYTKDCNVCKQFKKPPPVPIVCLPLASEFNEVVAMDLVVLSHGKYIVHLIDLFTRYSAACIRTSKRQECIVDAILKMWIAYFGSPRKFLADNGGEFANSEYRSMCESLNIEMMKTAAESPWSNGVCERHNAVIKESVLKTIEDTNCSAETAVAWAVSAKNSLHGRSGFVPNILVFGRNTNVSNVIENELPAMSAKDFGVAVADNIKAMQAARENYLKSESSEKIKRALSHNVRTSCEVVYNAGDKVYFKRNEDKQWRGPAKVLGQDGKTLLLKYDNQIVRVHVSRATSVTEKMSSTPIEQSNIPVEPQDQDEPIRRLNLESFIESDDDISDNPNTFEAVGQNQGGETAEQNLNAVAEGQNQCTITAGQYQNAEISGQNDNTEVSSDVNRNVLEQIKALPDVKSQILFKLIDSDDWSTGYVHSRAGKSTGKYKSCFNIQDSKTNQIYVFDFINSNIIWEPIPNEILLTNTEKESHLAAKIKELENWQKNDVFEEIPYENQKIISTRWVIVPKEINGIITTKARLVVRGFEDQDSEKSETNSPTCTKEAIRIALSIIAANEWDCKSIDAKAAFLQGKPLNRDIFVKPPKEAQTKNIWKLKKAVYGLNEASRCWYDKVKEELTKLGLTCSKFDEAFFFYKDQDNLGGLISVHVDDFLNAGDDKFNDQLDALKKNLVFGSDMSTPMRFLGTNIHQKKNKEIIVHQDNYCREIEKMDIKFKENKARTLTSDEQYLYRKIVGQLNWLASQTRPDLSFDVCHLSTKLNEATIKDATYANKVIKKANSQSVSLKFSKLKYPIKLLAFCDASYANLPDGSSQGGTVIFLSDDNNNVSPISWWSKKLRRVCKSTEAAETMAMLDAIDACIWISSLLKEIDDDKFKDIIIHTDNKSLFENIHSTTAVAEKRLRVEIAAIRESVRKK